MKKLAPYACGAIFLVLASCATTKGALFDRVLASSPAPAQSSSTVAVQPSTTNPEQTGLEVQTNPTDAQVYLNGIFIGDTPLLYTNFSAGTYKITISKRGYYDSVRWLRLDPTAYTVLQTDLTAKTGYLSVTVTPANAQVFLDGLPSQAGTQQLPIGLHTVRVRAFGYEDWQKTVSVQENQTVSLAAVLAPAPFRVSGLSASRSVVSPRNPGVLGRVVFTFDVSTRGEGTLAIAGPGGKQVLTRHFPSFTRRKQSMTWNGRSQNGTLVANGIYEVTVSGREKPTSAPSTESIEVTVDRGALIGLRSMLSGTAGLLYAGTPEVLPVSSYAVSALVIAHADSSGAIIPAQLAFRAVPHAGIELDGQGMVELTSTHTTPFSVGLAAKFALLRPEAGDGLSAAVSLKGTYLSGTTSDTLTNFTGLSVGLPLEYRVGPFGVVMMPEVIAAPYAATYTSTLPSISPAFWAYGRGGVFLDFGSIMTGLSVAFRSQPFANGLGLASVPLAAGWELHWLIPHTQLVLTAAVAGEGSPGPAGSFYLLGGAGIGFVN